MLIRRASPEDAEPMFALERASDAAAHWPRDLYDKLSHDATRLALVAADGVTFRGFIVAHCIAEDWDIENLVVAAAERRQGIGRELLRALLQQAEAAAARRVVLEVRESNAPALVLYEKAGFFRAGRRKSYYSNPIEDALVLVMEIGGNPGLNRV